MEQQRLLDDEGGGAILLKLAHKSNLPPPIPVGLPFTRIVVIPLLYLSRRVMMYYGYGKIHLLYDCSRTVEHDQTVTESKERSLSAFKALGDENRLKILKHIAQNEKMLNGKFIAEKLSLSPSVVSRHLSQLKDAGFIDVFSRDNRNINYSFNLSRIRQLSDDLESYIKD